MKRADKIKAAINVIAYLAYVVGFLSALVIVYSPIETLRLSTKLMSLFVVMMVVIIAMLVQNAVNEEE